MKQLIDLFPAIAFFAHYYGFGKDIIQSTIVLMVACVAQVLLGLLLYRKADRMHLVTLGIVLVFGGLTLAFHDEAFIKWKPTIVDLVLAGTLAVGQFIGTRNFIQRMAEAGMQRMAPEYRIDAPPRVWTLVNLAAILFFLACGALNIWVAYHFDNDTWMNMKTIGFPLLNVVFMLALFAWLGRYTHESPDQQQTP